VPVAAEICESTLTLELSVWAKLLACKVNLSEVLSQQSGLDQGSLERVRRLLAHFDVASFQQCWVVSCDRSLKARQAKG